VEKCADSIPIHRIERRFGRLGIPISRSTMNDLAHTAAEIVRPLVARLQSRIAALDVVLADETSSARNSPAADVKTGRYRQQPAPVLHGDDVRAGARRRAAWEACSTPRSRAWIG
jgi:hypothetical protein